MRHFFVGISDTSTAHVHSERKWSTDYDLIEYKHYEEMFSDRDHFLGQTKELTEILVKIKGELNLLLDKEQKRHGESSAQRRTAFVHCLNLISEYGKRWE